MAWELFCTETNLVPEVTYKHGAIIILDIPILSYGQVGRICQSIFKYCFQQSVLRRNTVTDPRPVAMFIDESQFLADSFDHLFLSVARSSRCSTTYLTQNLSNYLAAFGHNAEAETHALLGNFQTKIFHANTDHKTNQYASDIVSQEWMMTHGYSTGLSDNDRNLSSSASEAVHSKLLPSVFTTLRRGGPPHLEVEGVVFQGGRIWQKTQDTYLTAIFKQGQ